MPVKILPATGAGSVTVQAENAISSDFTLTLPARTGNIITSADSGTVTGTMLASATVTQSNLASGIASNGPAFSAYQSTLQSVPNSSWTKVQFQTEEFDTASCYDNTTNYRFTPNVAGYYFVNSSVGFASPAVTTEIVAAIYKNNSDFKRGYDLTSAFNVGVSALIYLNGTSDYIETYISQSSGGAKNTTASSLTTFFQAFLARAA